MNNFKRFTVWAKSHIEVDLEIEIDAANEKAAEQAVQHLIERGRVGDFCLGIRTPGPGEPRPRLNLERSTASEIRSIGANADSVTCHEQGFQEFISCDAAIMSVDEIERVSVPQRTHEAPKAVQ